MEEPAARKSGYKPAATLAAVLVFLYFFLPVVYLVPLIWIYKDGEPPPLIDAMFQPLESLGRRFPMYQHLLDQEDQWCRSLGLYP